MLPESISAAGERSAVGTDWSNCRYAAAVTDHALLHDLSLRAGAVHIELPEDIAHQTVPEDEAVLYNRDRVRRPIPEDKALRKAVDMIRVGRPPPLLLRYW